MCSNAQYQRLYDSMASRSYPSQKLQHVTNTVYGEIIHSKRQLERIRSVKDLLKILQKRDYINPDKYEVLLEVADVLEISTAVEPTVTNSIRNDDFVFPRLGQTAKERVYKRIVLEIGQKWPDFARALGVREGYIDSLHSETNHTNRIYKILKFHEDNCDPRFWKSILLEALTKARRNDLRRTVQNEFDILPM